MSDAPQPRALSDLTIGELRNLQKQKDVVNNRYLSNAVGQMLSCKIKLAEAQMTGDESLRKIAAAHYEKARTYWLRSQESMDDQAKRAYAKMVELQQTVKAGVYNPRLL